MPGNHSSTMPKQPYCRCKVGACVVLPQPCGPQTITVWAAVFKGVFMSDEFRRVFFPYCLEKQADGRYAVLNRNYKPVGFTLSGYVEYSEHPCLVKLKDLTPVVAAKLNAAAEPTPGRIYLYTDGSVPTDSQAHWDAYQRRLQVLASLTIGD